MANELLTIQEVALIMRIGEDAAAAIFSKHPGVIDLGRAENRHRRRYRILRIPKMVLEGYLSKKAGRTVTVEAPPRAERRRASPNWITRAAMNLAKAALQNECTDRRVLQSIAVQARALLITKAPEKYWTEILEDWPVGDED